MIFSNLVNKIDPASARKDALLAKFEDIDPYEDKGTELHLETISTIEDAGTQKIVIDKTQTKVSLHKWDSEVQLGITYQGPAMAGATKDVASSKITWEHPDQKMECIPVVPTIEIEDGGIEINIILNSVPVSNVFTFQLENWEDLDFIYQPPLWQQAGLKEPTAECTDTVCKIRDEKMRRSENVVGSYAVFHKTKANHLIGQLNYATGKTCHIYRPLVTDNDGNKVWAELSIANGVLTVTVPQDFLNNAVYPVKIDPTFGYTTIGATSAQPINARGLLTGVLTAVTGDTITKFTIRSDCPTSGNNGTTDLVAYTVSGGVPVTRTGTAQTITILNATPTWYDSAAVSVSLTNGTVYTVAFGNNVANTCTLGINFYLDAGTPNTSIGDHIGAHPATWTELLTTGNLYSVYATYTQASGSLIKTVNGLAVASVKTVNDLAIASVKTINGLTNV